MGPLSQVNVAPHQHQQWVYGRKHVRRLPASCNYREDLRQFIDGHDSSKSHRCIGFGLLPLLFAALCTSGCQESIASMVWNTDSTSMNHGSTASVTPAGRGQDGLTPVVKQIPAGNTQALVNAIRKANKTGGVLHLQLAPGTYQLPPFSRWFDMDQRRHHSQGEIYIKSEITLTGAGPDQTILQRPDRKDGESFRVTERGKLNLIGVALNDTLINHGQLEMKNVLLDGASAINKSGAYAKLINVEIKNSRSTAFVNYGMAEIRHSHIHGNTDIHRRRAGGLLSKGKFARLDVFDSFITRNVAQDECGGILAENSKMNISRSTISHNKGGALGGGICVFGSKVSIRDSALVANVAVEGGGMVNAKAMLSVTNVTLAQNLAYKGAGLFAHDGLADTRRGYKVGRSIFRNSTITQNGYDVSRCSSCEAGGMYIHAPHDVKLENSILADNRSTVSPECRGELTSWGGNLYGPNGSRKQGCLVSLTKQDYVGDPGLGKLVDRKVAGQMYVILTATSPAIDAASQRCTDGDQLGDRRWDGDHDGIERCDIGAVEYFDQQIYLASHGQKKQ